MVGNYEIISLIPNYVWENETVSTITSVEFFNSISFE
jgi:hypothetical protein